MNKILLNNDTALKFALSKVESDRDALEPGLYQIDETVHIKGTLSVGEDYLKTPTASIPLIETLALFMKYTGCTGENAYNALTKAMMEALEESASGKGSIAAKHPKIIETMEKIKADFAAKLPKKKSKGPTKVSGLTVQKLSSVAI